MFRFKLRPANPNAKPLRSIEREVEATREKFNNYLKNSSDDFMARRGDVKIKDPHTMVNDSYWTLRDKIDTFSHSAKKANKKVTFEDARVLTRDVEDASPILEEELGKSILISVKDKMNGRKQQKIINIYDRPNVPFMKKISNALGEMFTGQKGANLDKELGI